MRKFTWGWGAAELDEFVNSIDPKSIIETSNVVLIGMEWFVRIRGAFGRNIAIIANCLWCAAAL